MKKAFSLIELSIVILIIGILVAGVTQSSRLISQMRLSAARAQTNSAPIHSIRDVVFWFEPTLEESFLATESEDNSQISLWNDSNIQSVAANRYYAVKTASSGIVYRTNTINNLPGLQFSGATSATGYLTLSTTTAIGGATNIQTTNNRFTIFIVSKNETLSDTSNNRVLFYNGNSGTTGYGYYRSTDGKKCQLFGGVVANCTATATATTNAEVLSMVYQGNGSTWTVYVNGTAETFPSLGGQSPAAAPTLSFFIGGTNLNTAENWRGFLSEFIMFDRALKTEERQSIEKYLGKKYGIKVN